MHSKYNEPMKKSNTQQLQYLYNRNLQNWLKCCTILLFVANLSGCAAVAVGGIAGAALVDRRTTGTIVEDEAIELKINKALFIDENLYKSTHINTVSYNNTVLVTGEVPSDSLLNQVMNIVTKTEKVRHVVNEVVIAKPTSMVSRSNDSLITAKVKANLLKNKDVKGLAVKVVTERGIVYLMGLVTHSEAKAATTIARQISGVQKVVTLFEYIQ